MSDEQNTQTNEAQTTPTQAQNSENHVPQSRFSEVVSERNALKERLEKLEAAQRQAEENNLLEQKRYQELYEKTLKETEPLKEAATKAERLEQRLKARNESLIAQVPDDLKSIIPDYDDPVKLDEWLTANLPLLLDKQKPKAPSANGGAGGGGSAASSANALSAGTQAVADIAKQFGYTVNEERIAQFAKNPIKPNVGD